MRWRHFLLTNFNVPLPGADIDPVRLRFSEPEWLAHRCELFERFCLPSVEGQSFRGFEWVVRSTPPSDAATARRFADYARRPGVRWLGPERSFRSALAAIVDPRDELIVTTRLDNDDALCVDAMGLVNEAARSRPPAGREFFDLPVGFVLGWPDGELRRQRMPSNHFLSLAERRSAVEVKTVRQVAHPSASQIAPLRTVSEAPMWLEVVHGDNLANRLRGEPVDEPELATRFGLGTLESRSAPSRAVS